MLFNEIDSRAVKSIERYRLKSRLIVALTAVITLVIVVACYHALKPLPQGMNFRGQSVVVNESDVEFLFDLTNRGQVNQQIFDTIFQYIDEAEQYILIDMFLVNDWQKYPQASGRSLSSELVNHLIAKKQSNPDILIDFITDPINTVYGGDRASALVRLAEAGINVVVTDLTVLPDSNPWYSAWWRTLVSWLGNSSQLGYLPHPFNQAGSRVSLRSYLGLLNFKANHRKIFVADNQGQLVTVIGSANPHDASYLNSNAGVAVTGALAEQVYQSEQALAKAIGVDLYSLPANLRNQASPESNKFASVALVTEGQIKQQALAMINNLSEGDSLDLAMFYLSESDILRAIISAGDRGVKLRLVLDANQQAFGYKKIGVPNQPSAKYLKGKLGDRISIKWYQSMGEQFHTKMIIANSLADKQTKVLTGSANLTRRNLNNLNLEADVYLELNSDWDLAKQVNDYFNKLWQDDGAYGYTVAYEQLPAPSWALSWLSWFQERSGLSSF
jgi:phosphatidylserine/phosphatidylglycerophosphate/cardiolipin synthase-like enzyme